MPCHYSIGRLRGEGCCTCTPVVEVFHQTRKQSSREHLGVRPNEDTECTRAALLPWCGGAKAASGWSAPVYVGWRRHVATGQCRLGRQVSGIEPHLLSPGQCGFSDRYRRDCTGTSVWRAKTTSAACQGRQRRQTWGLVVHSDGTADAALGPTSRSFSCFFTSKALN